MTDYRDKHQKIELTAWEKWDIKNFPYKDDGCEEAREAYKSALKREIEKDIIMLTKKIDERTVPQAIGYIAQREQSKWFLKLLDTVEP